MSNTEAQDCPRIERQTGDHPLQTGWAFWYDKKQYRADAKVDYKGQLHKIAAKALRLIDCHVIIR